MRAFRVRLEQQDFVESDSFVAQQVRRMRAYEHLSTCSALHPREYLGQEPNNIWVERQFRFFQQQWPRTVQDGPEETQEPQRSVGELLLRLPRPTRPPMLVAATQVGRSFCRIPKELKLMELGNCDFQRLGYAPQSGIARFFWGARDLLQKIRAKWVLCPRNISIRVANELRD
jgi:hypothetical protein